MQLILTGLGVKNQLIAICPIRVKGTTSGDGVFNSLFLLKK